MENGFFVRTNEKIYKNEYILFLRVWKYKGGNKMFLYQNYNELFDNSAIIIHDERKEYCDIDRNYHKLTKRIEVYITLESERVKDGSIIIDKEQPFEDAANTVVDLFQAKFKDYEFDKDVCSNLIEYFTDRVEITSVYPITGVEQCLCAVIKYD